MKKCKECGETKALSDFYMQYGRPRPYCKTCWKSRGQQWEAANKDARRTYFAMWKKANRTLLNQRNKEARRTRWLGAHKKVELALKKGVLVRPERCESCNAIARVEAHHDDYTRPLDVQWLCIPCHKKIPVVT